MSVPRNAVMTDRGRFYRWGDESFRSITNIIGKGMNKPALPYWAAKSAAQFVVDNVEQVMGIIESAGPAAGVDLIKGSPWRQRDKAADVGTSLHDAAEGYALGKVITVTPEVQPYVDSFLAWVAAVRPTFEAAEFTVYSRSRGYAGTGDAIMVIGRERWLVDYKTGATGPWPEAALQLAALRYAEFVGLPDGTEAPVPVVDRCGILKVRPEATTLYPFQADETIHRHFLYCAQTAVFVDELAKNIIGAPEHTPVREAVAS